jgi:hypothetical protein
MVAVMPCATTLKPAESLKARIASIAAAAGKTTHALIIG